MYVYAVTPNSQVNFIFYCYEVDQSVKLHNIIYESILKKIIRSAISLSGLETFCLDFFCFSKI